MNDSVVLTNFHRIFAVGFGVRLLAMLKAILERYGEKEFALSPAEEADILLVNGDILDIAAVVQKLRATRLLPAIVVSTQSRQDIPDALSLLSPLTAQSLLGALRDVAQAIETRIGDPVLGASPAVKPPPVTVPHVAAPSERASTQEQYAGTGKNAVLGGKPTTGMVPPSSTENGGSASRAVHAARQLENELGSPDNRGGLLHDVDLRDPAQLERVYFNPAGFLSEYLRGALNSENAPRIIELTVDDKLLVFDFIRNRWGGDLNEQELSALCLRPLLSSPDIRFLDELSGEMRAGGRDETVAAQTDFSRSRHSIPLHRTQRAEFVLAQIGLWCTRGHLPKGTDVHAPLFLRYWPNLPQLPRTPGAMRIAALWAQRPCSLAKVVELTGLPQRHVFAFYAICDALCLFVKRPTTSIVTPSARAESESLPAREPAATHGFLRRLLQKIWPNSNDA